MRKASLPELTFISGSLFPSDLATGEAFSHRLNRWAFLAIKVCPEAIVADEVTLPASRNLRARQGPHQEGVSGGSSSSTSALTVSTPGTRPQSEGPRMQISALRESSTLGSLTSGHVLYGLYSTLWLRICSPVD